MTKTRTEFYKNKVPDFKTGTLFMTLTACCRLHSLPPFPLDYIKDSFYISSNNETSMLDELEKIFKALSDKNRIRILKMLQKKPLCVCEIREVLKLAVSTVSKHLSILREAGLINDWKEGKWINYRLNPQPSQMASNALLFVQLQIEDDETIKKDRKITCCVDRNVLCCKN